jgi:putative transposase
MERIVREADACRAPGEVGALLRREALYSSHLTAWRRQLREHGVRGLARRKRGPAAEAKPSARELQLEREKKKLEVWSWDITKLRGPAKWTYFYLYVLLDIFSRYVVGWMVARCESAALASKLFGESLNRHGIQPGQPTVHSDRGGPMRAKCFALLLADLGVVQSFGRPHVSDDNPFSVAQFKTVKYRPDFPDRFGGLEDCRAYLVPFFDWTTTAIATPASAG